MRRLAILAAAAALAAAISITSTQAHEATHPSKLAKQISRARLALAPFATSIKRAKARGYALQITPMMENMGFHFMNPKVKRFDVRRPPILVYVRRGKAAQLVAAEWVFPETPAKPPLPGARYGSFPAACHYAHGTFTPESNEAACAPRSPDSGAKFTFWHPDLVTMHLWLWYPNPDGVFNSTNRLVAPFNTG